MIEADDMQTTPTTVTTLPTSARPENNGKTRHPGLDWCKTHHPPNMIDPNYAKQNTNRANLANRKNGKTGKSVHLGPDESNFIINIPTCHA
jgi:hypothetical protein